MATRLTYTLVSDGPTDRALLPIINWVLRKRPELEGTEIREQQADLRNRPRPQGLAARIAASLDIYPCDVLFVHRDAEASDRDVRRHRMEEIRIAGEGHDVPIVRVVPVRMTEAWLLFDARAIKIASGNPSSKAILELPPLQRLESLPDPKEVLHHLLLDASELSGRRRDKLRAELSCRRVEIAQLIDDFTPLLKLSAFAAFVEETGLIVTEWLGREA